MFHHLYLHTITFLNLTSSKFPQIHNPVDFTWCWLLLFVYGEDNKSSQSPGKSFKKANSSLPISNMGSTHCIPVGEGCFPSSWKYPVISQQILCNFPASFLKFHVISYNFLSCSCPVHFLSRLKKTRILSCSR